ncbi:flagellar protein FlaG [Alteromonas oceanisediminis]|uniref:flagellar protein FlaG n=1 Tax=Alteromonas oceanisediminis TaxID=2836180 RepID=UPI001BD9D6F4|nr:flagellar protein FlaG [Alteromonas oceanisediminis]MBT0584959.1 flagellar protein FlaG [Alteromonas oceanisediminis]
MEIPSSQIGQSFAAISSSALQSRVASDVEGTSSARGSTQGQASGVNSELQRFNEAASQTQENARDADNRDSEQRNTTLELEDATREIEQFLQVQNRSLSFSVDENTDRSVVTVTEAESGDVIRQIPSEEVLRLAERLKDLQADVGSSVGVLFNNRA